MSSRTASRRAWWRSISGSRRGDEDARPSWSSRSTGAPTAYRGPQALGRPPRPPEGDDGLGHCRHNDAITRLHPCSPEEAGESGDVSQLGPRQDPARTVLGHGDDRPLAWSRQRHPRSAKLSAPRTTAGISPPIPHALSCRDAHAQNPTAAQELPAASAVDHRQCPEVGHRLPAALGDERGEAVEIAAGELSWRPQRLGSGDPLVTTAPQYTGSGRAPVSSRPFRPTTSPSDAIDAGHRCTGIERRPRFQAARRPGTADARHRPSARWRQSDAVEVWSADQVGDLGYRQNLQLSVRGQHRPGAPILDARPVRRPNHG